MGEVEFGFQIESYGDLFNAIFSLPPRLLPASANSVKFISLVLGKSTKLRKVPRHNIFDGMIHSWIASRLRP